MKIVLLGAPGCGKGTQSAIISKDYGIPQISTGDLFRNAMSNKTALGVLAKQYIDKGQLVPDDVTINLVKDRLNNSDCKNGFILDGFPRTINQARDLDKISNIDKVIYFDIDYKILEKRIESRLVCKDCKFTTTNNHSVCPRCGGELTKRADDNVDVLRARLVAYDKETLPLKDYYKKQNKLFVVNASNSVQEVNSAICNIIGDIDD